MNLADWVAACTLVHQQEDAAVRPANQAYEAGYAAASRLRDEALALAENDAARVAIKTAFNLAVDELRHQRHLRTGPAWRESDAALLTIDAEYRRSLFPPRVAAPAPD